MIIIFYPTGSANGTKSYRNGYDNALNRPVYPKENKALIIACEWRGTSSSDWNDPSNWCNGVLPDAATDIIIPTCSHQPIINSTAECRNIIINAGATLTILDNNILKVYGYWSNNGSFIANQSTVIFAGALQAINGTNIFNNVTIAGTGKKNLSLVNSLTVNGILSMEGSAAAILSASPNYGPNASLRYNVAYSKYTGQELNNAFTGVGGIIIDNTGPVIFTNSTVLSSGVPLTINNGATLMAIDKTITLGGDLHINGNFSLRGTEIVIGPGTATQFIDGFSSDDVVTLSKTGGVATFTGNISAAGLNTNGSGTLHLGSGLTHTFTGTWTRGTGTLNGGSSTLRWGGIISGSSGLFIPEDGTVEWFSSSPVSIFSGTYNNLVISGSGLKTAATKIYIKRKLTIEAGAQLYHPNGIEKLLSISDPGELNIHGTLRVGSIFPANFSIFNNEAGTVEYDGALPQSVYLFPYNNLILSGASKKFTGSIQIAGNLTIRNGCKVDLSSFVSSANTLTLENYGQPSGDWGGLISGATFINTYFFSNTAGKLMVVNNSSLPGLWVGRTSNWATPSNWSDGIVPTRLSDAIITTNGRSAEINGAVCCKNLFISPQSTLTLLVSNTLSISGNWINQGTFNANSGTVIFDGESQMVGKGPYGNLTMGGSGSKTVSEVQVNGIFSMEGTAIVSGTIGYLLNSTLQYNCTEPRTIGSEWPLNLTAKGIIIKNSGTISLPSYRALNRIPLTIQQGATLDLGISNLFDPGEIRLECGGETAGSVIKGTGKLTLGDNITVTNSNKGIAAARIDCPMALNGFYMNVSDGNPNAADPTDLALSNIASGTITKNGGGTISLTGSALLTSITINAGYLIIQPHAMVSLAGNLTNNVGASALTLLSDDSATGSLMVNILVVGTATVKRWMTPGAWHLISSPLDGQSIQSFLNANNGIPAPLDGSDFRGMRAYDPASNQWGEFFTSTTTGNMAPGKGFSIRVMSSVTPHEVIFTGIPTGGDKTIGDLSAGNWNCIGNPYTSSIGISAQGAGANTTNFLTYNSLNLDPSYGIYIWDKTDQANGQPGQYTVISNVPNPVYPYYYLQQGQGFMVKMAQGKNIVSFTKSMQVHNPSLSLKSAHDPWPSIQLEVTADSVSSSTLIAFHDQMTKGLDVSYDAGLLKANSPINLFTRLVDDTGIDFAIQALPGNVYDQLIIPLGVEYNQGGEVRFSALGLHLPASCQPVLEDRQAGIFTNLDVKDYSTHLPANTSATGRFYLHTSYVTTTTESAGYRPNFSARIINKSQMQIRGNAGKNARATLLDIQGRCLGTWSLGEELENIIDITPGNSAMYILQVLNNGHTETFKLANIF